MNNVNRKIVMALGVLSLLTGDLKEVGLTFSSCEIYVLDEFVEHP